MVKLLFFIMLALVFLVDRDNNINQAAPTERSERTKWRFPSEAEARATCVRPAYMITTATQDCYRIPTAEKPICSF